MKYPVYLALGTLAILPLTLSAQSPVDAYNLSQTELRGTARFMSMGGAFTALGGDLSTLNQNPAGIGIYRSSEVGLTLDLNILGSKANGTTWDNTHFDVNSFGYVGTYNFGQNSTMQTFSWGVSYSRLKSFARQYRGGGMPLNTSMSNYIAKFTDGIDPADMTFSDGYNPYQSSNIDWLSILSYSAGIINPEVHDGTDNAGQPIYQLGNRYSGLFQHPMNGLSGNPTTGNVDAFSVRERGYVDEYSINFGGNVSNIVYWGLGIGIDDINFEQVTYYGENLVSANVPVMEQDPQSKEAYYVGIDEGNDNWNLRNSKKITGTGVNLKFGLIVKPVNELRIGAAIHTPTWYSLSTSYVGEMSSQTLFPSGNHENYNFNDYTDDAYFDWNLKTPWKFMIGASGVIGGRGIISVDYQYDAYGSMKTSDSQGDFDIFNQGVKNYFKSTNTLRIGGEYRITPQFSVRAGYNYSSTAVKPEAANGDIEVITAGTDPGYTLQNTTNTFSAGLGYRSRGFYVDFAYLYRHTDATYHAFTNFQDYNGNWVEAPTAKVDLNSSQLVLTLGYKF